MSPAEKRIRQVAIVMQSLDATTAKGLIAELPPDIGKQVRQTMTRLGPISAAEREMAMNSLEGLLGINPSDLSNVDDSPAAAILSQREGIDRVELSKESRDFRSVDTASQLESETPWLAWSPASLAQLLADERPTVIATVINQLSPERAKALLDHLPLNSAASTLAALPNLFLMDESIVADILAEIDRKLPKTPPSHQTAKIAGLSKLSAIIDQFNEPQKQAWLQTIANQNPEVAMQLGWVPAAIPRNEKVSLESESSVARSGILSSGRSTHGEGAVVPTSEDLFESPVIIPIHKFQSSTESGLPGVSKRGIDEPQTIRTTQTLVNTSINDAPSANPPLSIVKQFDEIAQLADGDLVALLHSCERSVVLAAIAGASPMMKSRMESLIPKSELRRYRTYLGQSANFKGISHEDSQKAILEKAHHWIVSGRISPLENFVYLASA